MKLLILILAISLQAKTLYIIDTDELFGRCIETGDIIIKPRAMPLVVPRGIQVINCPNRDCVDYEIKRIKHLYRTNGIGIQHIH